METLARVAEMPSEESEQDQMDKILETMRAYSDFGRLQAQVESTTESLKEIGAEVATSWTELGIQTRASIFDGASELGGYTYGNQFNQSEDDVEEEVSDWGDDDQELDISDEANGYSEEGEVDLNLAPKFTAEDFDPEHVGERIERVATEIDGLYDSVEASAERVKQRQLNALDDLLEQSPLFHSIEGLLSHPMIPASIRKKLYTEFRSWSEQHKHRAEKLKEIIESVRLPENLKPELASDVQRAASYKDYALHWINGNSDLVNKGGLHFLKTAFDTVISRRTLQRQVAEMSGTFERYKSLKPQVEKAIQNIKELRDRRDITDEQKILLMNQLESIKNRLPERLGRIGDAINTISKMSDKVDLFDPSGQKQMQFLTEII
ncbi:MAG: hypothetical protein AAF202_12645, partial [Pseudomonadota bacterium]